MMNNYNIENAIKLTNKVMLNSKNEINMVDNIPDYKDVEAAIKEFESMNLPNEVGNTVKENKDEPVEQLETSPVVETVTGTKEEVIPQVENVVIEQKEEQVEPIVEVVETIEEKPFEALETVPPLVEQLETPVLEQNINVETLNEVDVPKQAEEIILPQQNTNEVEIPVLETPVQNPNNNQNIDNNGVING